MQKYYNTGALGLEACTDERLQGKLMALCIHDP